MKVYDDLGNARVVTVFPDRSNKYLSTDPWREEPLREDPMMPEVELIAFFAPSALMTAPATLH